MIKTTIKALLLAALTSPATFGLCKYESCSDAIKTLNPATLQAIALELANTDSFDICTRNERFTDPLHQYLQEARCSAEAIHAVYAAFADQLTPEQAKYLFSRAPEAALFLDKLIFGLEYAKCTLEDTSDNPEALEHVRIALNKSKVTHCPHCYIKIIIPAIESALILLETETSPLGEDSYEIIY